MLTMKTAHGKYVGTDKFGIVGVEREAVGLQEGWNFEVLPEESPLDTEEIKEVHKLNHGPSATPSFARFALKSCNGWYLGVKWDESRNRGIIRADGDHVSALAGETQEVPKSKLKGGANLATESTSGSWFYILIQAQVRAKLNYVEVVTEKGVGDLETEERYDFLVVALCQLYANHNFVYVVKNIRAGRLLYAVVIVTVQV